MEPPGLRLRIRWPDYSLMLVRVLKDANSKELASLLKFSVPKGFSMIFIFSGNILDSDLPLKTQGIINDSEISIEFLRSDLANKLPIIRKDYQERQDYYLEELRLNDMRITQIDSLPAGKITFEEILSELYNENSDADSFKEENIIPSKPKIISKHPLPQFWLRGQESDDDCCSVYSTLEEAAAFISKKRSQGWSW